MLATQKLTKDMLSVCVLRIPELQVYKVVVMAVEHDEHQPPVQYSYSSNVNVQSIVAYDAFNATTNDYGR